VRITDCGDPAASSVISTLPVRLPSAVGLNATLMVQLAPAATGAPQVLPLMTKSPAFAPPVATAVIVKGPVPLLFTVIVWLALAVPVF
jgi:hypothetical protein